MGVAASGATLEIQLVADVARLKSDMAAMQAAIGSATGNAGKSFDTLARGSAAAAAAQAAAAQTMARAAMTGASGMHALGTSAQNARIAMLDLTHVGINMSQMLATGVNPMRALMMESGRLATALQYSSGGISGLIKQLAQMVGVIRVSQDAELALAAATAQAAAQSVRAAADRAAATVVSRQTQVALAQATLAAAEGADAETRAQAKLVTALRGVQTATERAAIAQQALAGAESEAAGAAEAAAAAQTTMLGPAAIALGALAAVAGVAFGAVKQFQDQVRDSGTLDRFAEGLRLTDAQIKKAGGSVQYLADGTREITGLTVTFGDVMAGVFEEISKEANAGSAWDKFKGNASSAFSGVLDVWNKTSAALSAGMWTLGDIAKDVFQYIGQKIGQGFYDGVNKAIDAINSLNAKIPAWAGGGDPNLISHLKPDKAVADLAGLGATIRKQADKNYADALAANKRAYAGVENAAIEHNKRMRQIESDGNKPPKAKKQSDHGLAEALAELDAEIKGQWALAAAYQVSDAAAMKAEAMQKAEQDAIRHRGDVALFYERELAKATATRAAEGAKQINNLNVETEARKRVNDAIAAGALDASQAETALKDEAQLRSLMAARDAAQAEGRMQDVQRLTGLIDNLAAKQAQYNFEVNRTQVLTATSSGNDQLEKLRLEATLIGATNTARAVAIAQLQAEQFLRDHPGASAAEEQAYIATQKEIARQTAANTIAQDNHNASLTATADMLKLINEQAQAAGQVLSDAFGGLGDSVGKALAALTDYAAKQEDIRVQAAAARKEAGADAQRLAQIDAEAAQKSATAQIEAVGSILSAAKGLFKEHSAGYEAMEGIEKAYAVAQLARTIASIAPNVAAGAAKMFSALGPFAFPAIAAMIAVMAGLGFGGGSSAGSAPTSPEDLQKAAGAGTVLGDPTAKSASIANALDIMSKNSTKLLDYSSDMVSELRSISGSIGSLAAAIATQMNLSGGFFDTTGKVGTHSGIDTSPLSLLLFGPFNKKTVTTSLFDQGYQFDPATIAQIIQQGIVGSTYQTLQKVTHTSGFLGIGGGTKTSYSTSTGPLDSDISGQIQGVVNQLYKSVVDAAKVLGLDVAGALQQFQVEIGKISFKDLTGSQITDQLNAVFSKLGDQMAGFAVSGLQQFQQAGEGLYQTLMRLAKDYLTVDASLKSIGMTFGSVGSASLAAREKLLDLAGGLDAFTSQVSFFYDHFLSDSQKFAMEQAQVTAAFQSMGAAMPTTISGFTQLVQSLDLSTDAGQQMFEALMQIAPAFYDVATAAEQLAQKQQELQVQLLQAQGKTAQATALDRQMQLAATDPSLQALQKQVWAAQDAAAAAAAATELHNKQTEMQIQLLQAQGKSEQALALQRQYELSQLDPSLRALQKQIYAAQDLATAKDNLTQAYQRESQALQQTVDKFRGFATTLKQFRDSLFTGGNSSMSYNQSLIALMQQAGLAKGGNEAALGGGLQDAATKFLDIANQNAATLVDAERARALVARYVDEAAASANGTADVAQQQLDSMHDQVSKLVDIDDHVLSVTDAINQLKALMFPSSSGSSSGSGGSGAHGGQHGSAGGTEKPHPVFDQILEALTHIHSATETGAVAANGLHRIARRQDRGGAVAVATDPDTPVAVTNA